MSVHALIERGLALLLARDGRLREILIDGRGYVPDTAADLFAVVADDCTDDARGFLERIADTGSAVGWALSCRTVDAPETLTFGGRRLDNDDLLVVAGPRTDELQDMFQDLLRINDEQANLLRSTMAELATARRGRPDTVEGLMQLNNELAALQREVAQQKVALERLNDQKDQLLGAVAHDLRNPLGAVSGFAQVLLDGMAGDLEGRQRLVVERMASAAEHMLAMVEDLVDWSAIGAGRVRLRPEDLCLASLVRDVAQLTTVSATAKGIGLTLDAPPTCPVVADPGKLRQVLDNLLSNAVKYSEGGTTIAVRVTADDDRAVIAVEDQGVGIPEGELAAVFEPFGTASVRGTAGEKSTGLGLAIARRIVTAHGGSIDVVSEVGVGSTFTVELPRRPEP